MVHARRRSARASATSGRTRTRTRSARRSTCCCARSRSARARTAKFDRHHRLGRPCLYAHIEKCAAPCVGDIDHDDYDGARRRSCSTSSTASTTPVARPARASRCTRRPTSSSSSARPGCATSSPACARRSSASRWSAPREEDYDLIGIAEDQLEASRAGVLRAQGPGRRPQGARRRQGRRRRDARARRPHRRAALRRRADRPTSPRRSSCPVEPEDLELYEEFLALQPRRARCGIRVPQRGGEARAARRPRRSTRSEAFAPAQAAARLRSQRPRARAASRCRRRSTSPRRRCASSASTSRNLQGTEIVASMVVMEDGLPKRSDYRRFKMQDARRPGRLRVDGRGADPPLPQLPPRARRGRARRASGSRTRRTCCSSTAARASSASRCACSRSSGSKTSASRASPSGSRRSTCPGESEPVRIPRDSEALYLLQQVRDEAHRFAITYHRQLRGKKMTVGARRRPRPRARPARRGCSRSSAR